MTGIWRKCLAHWDKCRQKGQILVFTAVLLPLLIAACGFTVDFGNMYMHKSKLQNAADAAAISGAYAYRDYGDTPEKHKNADDFAEFSLHDNIANATELERIYQARIADDGNTYYRVLLTEEVPVYFLRLFNVGNTVNVSADAVASISYSGGKGGIFDNLFSFGADGFCSINANQNPDNAGISSISNSSFYHGRIAGIGPDANMSKNYTHELLDTEARDGFKNGKYTYVKDAIADGKYVKLDHDVDLSLDEKLSGIMAGVNSYQGKEYNWSNGADISDIAYFYGKNYIYNKSGTNPELKITSQLPATSDKSPLYVVCDPWSKLTLQCSSSDTSDSRPVVFVYTGTGQINIEANNASFRGIIYAPNAKVHINDEGLKFYGSIAAKGLEITGKGTYVHENVFGNGSGSNNINTSVCLAVPPDNINWQ